jgi:hypothetical protein
VTAIEPPLSAADNGELSSSVDVISRLPADPATIDALSDPRGKIVLDFSMNGS